MNGDHFGNVSIVRDEEHEWALVAYCVTCDVEITERRPGMTLDEITAGMDAHVRQAEAE